MANTAALGDRVWNDINRNGIQDANETGLAGVSVKLTNGSTTLISTTTDSNGFYKFTNLAAGQYKVQFAAPTGYSFTTSNATGASDAVDSDANNMGLTAFYSIADGENNMTIDAGLIANRAPVANNDSLTTQEDTPLTVAASTLTANDTDADGDTLTIVSLSNPNHGSFSLQNNQFTFTPHPNYNGPASISYTIVDGKGGSSSATININVTASNDTPKADDDTVSMNRSHASISSNVITNDQDVDGDTLTVTAVRTGTETSTGTTGTVGNVLAGAYGTLTLNANGAYSYTLDHNNTAVKALLSGQSLTENFTYTINDGKGNSDSAQLTITINGTNGAITAKDDAVSMTENHTSVSSGVLANDIDPEGDTLSVIAIRTGTETGTGTTGTVGNALVGSYGTLTIKADGSYSYALNQNNSAVKALDAGQNLNDTFTYTTSDGKGTQDSAQLVVTITGINSGPDAVNDTLNITENALTGTLSVLSNDTDPENNLLSVTSYQAGNGNTATAGNVLTGYYGSLNIMANGITTYVLNNNNAAVNALDTDQELSEQFLYTNSDGKGNTDQAILTIKIKGVNDAPTASNDFATMTTNHASVSSNVLPNDIDPEGKTITVSAIRTGSESGTGNAGTVGTALIGSHGSLLLKADGSYTYNLDNSKASILALTDGQNLTDSFTYTTSDDKGNTDKAQLVVTINGVNDAPKANNDSANISENANTALSGNLISNDTDPESSTLTISAVRTGSEAGTGIAGIVGSTLSGQYGQLTLNSNGSYSYTLNTSNATVNALRPGDTLQEVFTYTTRDTGNLTDNAQLVITINGENDAPIAVNDTLSGSANTALTIGAVSLLATDGTGPQNDSDVDSASFSHIMISRLPVASSGTLMFDNRAATLTDTISISDLQNGKLRFVPANNFSGAADFGYKVSDGTLLSNEASVTLNFAPSSNSDDYSNNTQTTGSIAAGQSRNGNIETARDADWFAINMEANTTYRITLEGTPTQAGTLSDTYLNGIYNGQGVLLANSSNDDFGGNTNSQVTFTAASAGTYYISAGAYSNYTGSYRLSVSSNATPPSNDDYRNDITTTGKVTVNSNQTGNIETALDQDWFRVELSAGKTYRINLDGNTLTDTYIKGIHNSKGELLPNTSNDDFAGSRNAQITFTPNESGSYYISAAAYSSLTGTYRLAVTEQSNNTPTDDYSNNINTTGTIAAGQSKTGNIETAMDIDWFRAELQAGQSYRINLEGSPTAAGTLSDTFLKGIFNSSGNALPNTSNDDTGGLNSQVIFTPSSSGSYFIAAGAYGTLTGSYKLSVAALPQLNQLLDNSSSLDSLLGSSTNAAPANLNSNLASSSQQVQELGTTARLLEQQVV